MRAPNSRGRYMRLSDKSEEILEVLWSELVDGSKKSCDATLLKNDVALEELKSHGLMKAHGNDVTLTEKGVEEAKDCVRRHRLAERLLVDVFDLKEDAVHASGCEFEHLLHKGLAESVCTLLGHPRFCPHGRPIPEGKCCREANEEVARMVLPLSELEVNGKATVAYLHTHDKDALPKLMAMGVLPGTEIKILQRFPTIVFQVGKSQFAVDEKLAARVYVRRSHHAPATKDKGRSWKLMLGKINRAGRK